jgi:hypothetical protein
MKVYEVVPVPSRPHSRDGAAVRLVDAELYRRFTFLEAKLDGFPSEVVVRLSNDAPGQLEDVLFADVPWPLWSNRLLDALSAVGTLEHTRFAVRMVDVGQQSPRESGTHVFVHFPPKIDVLDRSLSDYSTSSFLPDMITQMKRPVLKLKGGDSGVVRCADWPNILAFGEAAEVLRLGPFSGYDLIDWSGAVPKRIQRSIEVG